MKTPACSPNCESLTAAKAGLVGVDPRQHEDRAEDLLGDDLRAGGHVGQHGRRVGGAVAGAAGQQLRPPAETASSTQASTRSRGGLADQRADVGGVVATGRRSRCASTAATRRSHERVVVPVVRR